MLCPIVGLGQGSLSIPSEFFQVRRYRALDGCKRFDHASGHCASGPDAVLAGYDVPTCGIQKPDDLVVPGGFAIALQQFLVHAAAAVVVDEHRDKFFLDGLYQLKVVQHFTAELADARSPRHLLEQNKHGFAGCRAHFEGRIEIAPPLYAADLDGRGRGLTGVSSGAKH